MRKVIVVFLLLCSLTAFSQTQQYDDESDFRIANENGGAVILEYLGSKQEVRIPPRIQNLPVTSIWHYSFYECKSLTSVSIPDSVTTIGHDAFAGCTSLTSVTIPDSVTAIGDNAFNFCKSLTSVTIPNGVTTIGDSAFFGCWSLTSITIPNGVTTIGRFAFSLTDLASVIIPNSVTSIGDNAFFGCKSLTSVTFQGTIASNGFANEAFDGLGDLRKKFYATDKTNGTPGTYTRRSGSRKTWTRM